MNLTMLETFFLMILIHALKSSTELLDAVLKWENDINYSNCEKCLVSSKNENFIIQPSWSCFCSVKLI